MKKAREILRGDAFHRLSTGRLSPTPTLAADPRLETSGKRVPAGKGDARVRECVLYPRHRGPERGLRRVLRDSAIFPSPRF